MREIPLIKEYRIQKLEECIICIDKYRYDRYKQKVCILRQYPGKNEKSVFRGMIIPSLRQMGLIVGYGDLIRLSANGKIFQYSKNINKILYDHVLQTIFYEIDNKKFGFINFIISKKMISKKDFLNKIGFEITAPNQKQKMERIKHWLSVLEQTSLLKIDDDKYKARLPRKETIAIDKFKKYLIQHYFEINRNRGGIVDITDLREKVALQYLIKDKKILTETRFDELLSKLPLHTNEYVISFGRSMGAEEKLFRLKDKYFRTIYIRLMDKDKRK